MITSLKSLSIAGLTALTIGATAAATMVPADAQVTRGYGYGMMGQGPTRSKLAAGYEYEYQQPGNYPWGIFNQPQPYAYGQPYGYGPGAYEQ